MKGEAAEIVTALETFYQPGDVFEVRVLDAVSGLGNRPHVESGYWDYEHLRQVPEALEPVYQYRGVYVTVNPPEASLLARAAYHLRDVRRDPVTADTDVPRRRWLLIDCDARRASGIPSSDREHEAALGRAAQIRAGMLQWGWPEPVYTDSGNGAQLMYRVDLPADDGGLCQQVIAAMAAVYSDKAVDIDLTVHNPARIWRLPGTFNVKGDEVGDRRHRLARILERPETLAVVTEQQLRGFLPATCTGTNIAPAPVPEYAGGAFDLDQWVRSYCPEAEGPKPWKDGRKWTFPVCPFNSAHANGSAVLIQQASGAVAFKCHHNGCAGNDWHALRELRDPGHLPGDHPAAVYGGEIVEPEPVVVPTAEEKAEAEREKRGRHADPGDLPRELLHVPGFISDVMEFTMKTAPYPNEVLAFAGALSLNALLTSRKFRDPSDVTPNVYLVALAQSGAGKDHPRKVNTEVASAVGMGFNLGDSFGSGEGIEDAMLARKVILYQADEMDTLFRAIKTATDGRMETMVATLLKFFSASNSIYNRRALAQKVGGQQGALSVHRPALSIFGTAVPQYFYEALSARLLDNGLMARCLILEADDRGEGQDSGLLDIPPAVLETAGYWASYSPGSPAGTAAGVILDEHPTPVTVPYNAGVAELLAEFRQEADQKYREYSALNDAGACALWNRANEKCHKLALNFALSRNPKAPAISPADAKRAWAIVLWQTRRQLYRAQTYVAENPFHELCLKFMRKLRAAGGKMPKNIMLRNLHIPVREMETVEQTLTASGEVQVVTEYTPKARAFYVAL